MILEEIKIKAIATRKLSDKEVSLIKNWSLNKQEISAMKIISIKQTLVTRVGKCIGKLHKIKLHNKYLFDAIKHKMILYT